LYLSYNWLELWTLWTWILGKCVSRNQRRL